MARTPKPQVSRQEESTSDVDIDEENNVTPRRKPVKRASTKPPAHNRWFKRQKFVSLAEEVQNAYKKVIEDGLYSEPDSDEGELLIISESEYLKQCEARKKAKYESERKKRFESFLEFMAKKAAAKEAQSSEPPVDNGGNIAAPSNQKEIRVNQSNHLTTRIEKCNEQDPSSQDGSSEEVSLNNGTDLNDQKELSNLEPNKSEDPLGDKFTLSVNESFDSEQRNNENLSNLPNESAGFQSNNDTDSREQKESLTSEASQNMDSLDYESTPVVIESFNSDPNGTKDSSNQEKTKSSSIVLSSD